jgi:CRISPR-associated endonuclease/helicase Cas3
LHRAVVNYANRPVSSESVPQPERRSAADALLLGVSRLAALFHDIGKANEHFQLMLRGEATRQHLRHELVSYLVLKELASSYSGLAFFQALASNPAHFFAPVDSVINSLSVPVGGFLESHFEETALRLLSALSDKSFSAVEQAVHYLVLTHHRQVAADVTDVQKLRQLQGVPSLRRHMNQLSEGAIFDPRNLTFSAAGLPWEDKDWLSAVSDNAQSVLQLLQDNPGLEAYLCEHSEQWAKSVALIARPTLIQADHLASAMKVASKPVAQLAYANSAKKNGTAHLADPLPVHLLKTRYACDPFFKGMSGSVTDLPLWTVPADSPIATPISDERYRWQEEAEKLIACVPEIQHRPFFGVALCGTGAGKTLGGPRALSAASGGRLRYTCALGLRSLTLQTGKAYREVLKISDSDAVTVIGDALYAQLSDTDFGNSLERLGSESLEEPEELLTDQSLPAGQKLGSCLEMSQDQLEKFCAGPKAAMLNEVPVLTCTTDTIIRASSLSGGKDTRMSLRLATADLILDEIDAYSLEDLQALGRLVHQAGCHGRRVLVMSATVSATVLQALFDAWFQGLKVWEFRTQQKTEPVAALLSNQISSEIVDVVRDDAAARLSQFTEKLSDALSQAKNRNPVIPLSLGKTKRETFRKIVEQAIDFARVHNTIDLKTGEKVSTGFIRFNKVENVRKFVRYVADEFQKPDDISLKLQSYHREMLTVPLSIIETEFNKVFNRKEPQAIFACPGIANWHAPGKLRIMLVATTSLQETGRDHDYDFAIAEIWSTRSIAQLAGRVLRHRQWLVASPNIAVLESSLDVFDERVYRRTEVDLEKVVPKKGASVIPFSMLTDSFDKGFQSIWRALSSKRAASFPMPEAGNANRSSWLYPDFYTQGVTARPCLTTAEANRAALSYLEQFAQEGRMYRPEAQPGLFSMADTFRVNQVNQRPIVELCWNRHNEVIEFRRQSSKKVQFTLNPDKQFREIGVVQRHVATGALEVKPLVIPSAWKGGTSIKNPDCFFIRTDLITFEDAMKMLGTDDRKSLNAKLGFAFELHAGKGDAFAVHVDYDPLLGASTSSSYLGDDE